MVKAGVKAVFSDDGKTVTTWSYPSASRTGMPYKLVQKTWKNECPLCTTVSHYKTPGKFKFNSKHTDEGELTCKQCNADFCSASGKDKNKKCRGKLTPATTTANSATQVADSQTKAQTCELTKAEALTKAKQLIKTGKDYKATLKIPIIKGIVIDTMCKVNFGGFPETKKKKLHISEIKEDIDNQTYDLTLEEGNPEWTKEYEGSYIFKDKNGNIIGGTDNPLKAKCQTVNTNIGLKDNSVIGTKIKLTGQQLGTVEKIYKWLRVKAGGGVGGWKYKKYENHKVKSEAVDKFGPKSAEECWKNKIANCVDFSWIMAKMGEGAGKKIGIKKGTYTSTSGKQQGHMWNYCGAKYYDCSSATDKTPDWKKVEKV